MQQFLAGPWSVRSWAPVLQPGTYVQTDSAAGTCPYKHGHHCRVSAVVFGWCVRSRAPMLQPVTYLETDSAAGPCLYKHGRPLSGICSSFRLVAVPYGVGRQWYSLVRISRLSRQLALAFINTGDRCRVSAVVFGSALIRTESGASATAWYLSRDRLGSWSLPL